MSTVLAEAAKAGFKDAASYEKFRPSFPAEAVSTLLQKTKLAGHTHAKVIDLAAGTGKFTELLAAQPEEFEIIAVEPHDGMRSELGKKELKSVTVKAGDSENIPVPDGWADGMIIAQVCSTLQ
jgi:ubiquinone/menaquinone biosynthesis C-methylase UbiE